ncbi:hypothetical protein HPT25_05375 [Bacillus sp. BRMEA1]|uniref:hypothetical protein n=1 Tax=Neobacillus endophyticus TaxID=2738405 RepID=UPI001564C018|nr:hypothetical protein [Neobacillus endophyticus]NRD76924.1 hypothetical protein [Neobacillus endophyticus]
MLHITSTYDVLSRLASRPGTSQHFAQHVDQFIQSVEKGKEAVGNQVKPTSTGANATIQTGYYPDITTGQPVTNFQPFFPSKDSIGAQVQEISYDAQLAPHRIPYTDIRTGTPVGKFSFVYNPPAVGVHINVSV